jgi:predicted nucleic acid-binding protein
VNAVLDAWALSALLEGEPAAGRVDRLITESDSGISSINLGEVYYTAVKKRGRRAATDLIDAIRGVVEVEDPDWRLVRAAAEIKARGGLSYADAFCVATAQRHRAPLYTGDLEIIRLDDAGVEIVDLRNQP